MDLRLATVAFLLASCLTAMADDIPKWSGGARIVQLPSPSRPRCINAKTDELTATLMVFKTHKRSGWFTQDNRAGLTIISTLNSDGNPKAQNPSVNLVDITESTVGQIYIPIQYSIATHLALSPDSGKTFTSNILLDIWIDKVRGANSFSKILETAGLGKLPIPANPYTNAVSSIVNFATKIIEAETKDSGGQSIAKIEMKFNNRDVPGVDQCEDFQVTGAIGVIMERGADGATVLALDKLTSDYCLRYVREPAYAIRYAKQAKACKDMDDGDFKEVPNDYLMMVISAQRLLPISFYPPTELLAKRRQDLEESRKLCEDLKLDPTYCGAN